MTDIFLGFASLTPVILAGFLVLSALDRSRLLQPAEKLALSYGIGSGLLVWEMLVFQTAGFSFAVTRLLALLLGVSAIAFLFARRRPLREYVPKTRLAVASVPFQRLEWLLAAGIVAEISGTFFRAWVRPMEAYDAVSNWGLKAKAIFQAGNIPEGFLRDPNYAVFHPDYPLLVPLLESYIYRFAGDLREASAKMIFPMFLAACVLVLFAALRRAGQTRRSCLLFSFLLVSIPYFSEQATNGYADVVVSFYFGAGSLCLYLWQTSGRGLFLALSALLTGCAALTKHEGLVLACIHLVWLAGALLCQSGSEIRGRLLRFGVYVCILAVVVMPWYRFSRSLGLRNDVINSETVGARLNRNSLSQAGPILYHLQTQVFGPKNWNLVWILLLAAAGVRSRILLRSPAVFLLGATALTVTAYMSVYLISPYTVPPFDVTWHLRTSASRLLVHVLPHAVFLIGLAFGEQSRSEPGLAQLT
jgi:hypothetical protein